MSGPAPAAARGCRRRAPGTRRLVGARRARRLAPVVPLLLLVAVARAGDATPSPSQRFERAVAALPAPDANLAFAFHGDVRVPGGEKPIGTLDLDVRPAPGAAWRVEERLHLEGRDRPAKIETTALLDRTLAPREGRLSIDDPLGPRAYVWRLDGTVLRVTTEGEGLVAMEKRADLEAPATTTLAAFLLFARLAKDPGGEVETRVFDPSWEYLEAGRPFSAARLAPGTPPSTSTAPEETTRTWTGAFGGGDLAITLGAGGAVREVRWRTEHPGPFVDLVARASAAHPEDEPPADVFDAPAGSPRAAALRVALAFAMGDAERFDPLVDWPALRKHMSAQVHGNVTDEAFRERILAQFRRQAAAHADGTPDVGAEEARLRGIWGDLEVASEGADAAVVTMPASYGGMRLTLGRADGVWRLVRLPGS